MSEHIEFVVRVPKGEADHFIARFGKENVRILGFLLGEEIVRCRDCLSWHRGKCYKHAYTTTIDGTDEYENGVFLMDASDFCSLGERRGDA